MSYLRPGRVPLIVVMMVVAVRTSLSLTVPPLDLAQIGHLAPKGRVQDKAYNPQLPIVDRLIAIGPSAIPFLVSELEDDSEIEGPVFDYWPRVTVGDVALVLLVDFFTMPDGTTTVAGLSWDNLLERRSKDEAAWDVLARFVREHGRAGLRRKVNGILKLNQAHYAWDPKDLCFRPAAETR